MPSEAAISDARASRKSPARIACRLPHLALTRLDAAADVGLVHDVVVVERAEVDQLDRRPRRDDLVGARLGGAADRAATT